MNKQFFQTLEGKEFIELLTLKMSELRNIENLKELSDPKEQAIELKAQKRAYTKIKEILSSIIGQEVRQKDERDSLSII